ncbi:MAG: hypothetical protein P1V97_01235, partial [Planctomycetota bacterium]|nr:hypothetical protein [Planctomycetota bacterium]
VSRASRGTPRVAAFLLFKAFLMAALGFDARESRKAVDAATKKLGETASSEELVRQALQEIS